MLRMVRSLGGEDGTIGEGSGASSEEGHAVLAIDEKGAPAMHGLVAAFDGVLVVDI